MKKYVSLGFAVATLVIGILATADAYAKKPVRICIPTLSGGRLCWISAG